MLTLKDISTEELEQHLLLKKKDREQIIQREKIMLIDHSTIEDIEYELGKRKVQEK